jgi:hypothetical protein
MRTVTAITCALVGVSVLSFPALAQQKTVKACQEEWRANKDANQAKGITEKAYVTQCRAGGVAAQPAPSSTTTAAPAPAATGEKTAKACRAEWRANKDANQAKGITEKAYVTQCRAGGVAAQPAPASTTTAAPAPAAAGQKTATACRDEWRANKDANQAKGITEKAYVTQCRTGATVASPAPMAPPPTQVAPPTQTTTTTAPPPATTGTRTATATPTGANQYSTEGQARFRCGGGTVVWANLDSKIYHFTGNREYGKTKTGAYMCEQDATSQGMRAAKNEKHP